MIEIKNDDWVSRDVSTNIGRGLKSTSSIQRELSEIREGIFSWVKQKNNPVFKYLSLIMLVDSVEAIARVWAETIIEHQKIAYSKRKKS